MTGLITSIKNVSRHPACRDIETFPKWQRSEDGVNVPHASVSGASFALLLLLRRVEGCRKPSPSSSLPTDTPSHQPCPPLQQLAPVLAYALYLHERQVIPDVTAQLSKQISPASSQERLLSYLPMSDPSASGSGMKRVYIVVVAL